MQVRLGNRQDEPIIKTIISQCLAESSASDQDLLDLTDIEAHYFWHNGLFIVAEDDGQIVGLAGARSNDNVEILELTRLFVVPARRKRGVARELLKTVFFFARGLEYKRVVAYPEKQGLKPGKPMLGFSRDPEDPKLWIRAVEAPT
jgi:N-acetylglutamate synthase-like GNAT family acetyltransferase